MLRPLLYLSALIGLAGAGQIGSTEAIEGSKKSDISAVPITFYGKKYEEIYVNLTSDKVAICFDGFYDPQAKQDCILVPQVSSNAATLEMYEREDRLENYYHTNVPTIENTHQGQLQIRYFYGSDSVIVLVNFGTEAVFYYGNSGNDDFMVETVVNGNTVDTFHIKGESWGTHRPFDITGCRYNDVGYKSGDVVSAHPDDCFDLICIDTGVDVTDASTCGLEERCMGNNICLSETVCAVTGPAVIDFFNQGTPVQDRCTYSLLSGDSVPGFQILANFRERRHQDVNFLDRVTLKMNQVTIDLEQGGRVLVDDVVQTLDSAEMFEGVELSKDQTGVTAKVSISDEMISVFFDGNTAHIHLEGPVGQTPSLQGLCMDSSSLDDERLLDESDADCEVEHSNTVDSEIDCTTATERCELLRVAPFTTCHSYVDPQPYITACTNTLCEYPMVDGLNCQFLEAYARTYSLHIDDTFETWRTDVGCSAPQAFCRDTICSDHEFCAENVGGDISCFCRAIYASPYKSTGSFGEPTVCGQNTASVTLVGCLLEEKGVNYRALHLNDESCTGTVDEVDHMVSFRFNSWSSCEAEVMSNDTHVMYKNTIMAGMSSSDIIIRHEQVSIDFSCVYNQPVTKTMSFKIKDSSVVQQITSGSWTYTLNMTAYIDAGLTEALESTTEVHLDQTIWVVLETDGLDGDLVAVVTDSCWATSQALPSSTPRYDLIINGCANPDDQTVEVSGNGLGTSNSFSFNMFEFTGQSSDIYLHCKLELCPKDNQSCVPTCNTSRRRRRFARVKYVDEAPAVITMVWTN